MITDELSAHFIVEKVKAFFSTPAGIFLYATTTSMAGVIILLMFLSTVLSPPALLVALPVIVAFNGAAGGYGLADKKEGFPHQKTGLGVLAVLVALTGCLTIPLFCPWEPLLNPTRFLVTGFTTLVFTIFGAWISNKSKALNKSVYQ